MSSHEQATTKRVGFLELFFDLVFVFAITQVVKLLHYDHSPTGWLQAGLVFWLIWWAWSQFAWAGNAIDLDHRRMRLAVLVVTGAMLLVATSIPDAFSRSGWWFIAPYVAVRLAGLGLYWHGVRDRPEYRDALRAYLPVALTSIAIVAAAGLLDGDWRLSVLSAAVVIDVISAIAAGRGEFHIDPGHFAERHGLIVIIAFGEALIAMGATADALGIAGTILGLLAASLLVVGGMWWCYFDSFQTRLEDRLSSELDHQRRGQLARDMYTFAHVLIVAGIILFAAAIEEVLAHPTEDVHGFAALALAAGPASLLIGFALAHARAPGPILVAHLAGAVAVVLLVWLTAPLLAPIALVSAIGASFAAVGVLDARRPLADATSPQTGASTHEA